MKRIATVLAWIACVGMVSPAAVFGEQSVVNTASRVHDVALSTGGTLCGQVVDQQGNAVSNVPVSIVGDSTQAQVQTDGDGRFQAAVTGGTYQVAAGGSVLALRAWSENTAPPVATEGVLVVCDSNIVRGQCNTCNNGPVAGPPMAGGYMVGPPAAACGDVCGPPVCGPAPGCGTCGGGFLGFISNPWVVGAVVAAAIAIPLAVANDDNDNAS